MRHPLPQGWIGWLVSAALCGSLAQGQETAPPAPEKQARAMRLAGEPPHLDGRLDEGSGAKPPGCAD